MVLILPFAVTEVENNLEFFLFLMGLVATIISGIFDFHLIVRILQNQLLYMISGAVLFAGILFKLFQDKIKVAIQDALKIMPLKFFIFLVVLILGLLSSIITAIIASLVLVEIINNLPLNRSNKVRLNIIACFAIGLGAVLTPIGEPLSTIVIIKMDGSFTYLIEKVGKYIIPGILVASVLSVVMVGQGQSFATTINMVAEKEETYLGVIIRAFKVFIFVMALELLGAGFKPFIDTYIINLDSRILYWINMLSAVLDNATIAAAEVSPSMSDTQVQAVLMGLLVSGGMLIPGNIPNIISAGKLKIKSGEWACLGLPLGLIGLVIYFLIIF
ncbi:MAG: hypothetical protein PWP31_996 [Clostridia bacterium]|nr:hypothetical protein [Clostridia bacterium]